MAFGQHGSRAAKDLMDDLAEKHPEHVPVRGDFTMADIMTMIKEVAKQIKASGPDDVSARQVELIERLVTKTHPENVDHPGISVYSHPEGDMAHAKAPLKCSMTWIGYELSPEVLTPGEIDLLNQLTAGEYTIVKGDGTRVPFRVTQTLGTRMENGGAKLERLDIWFPCKGDAKHNHLSMTDYCRQVLGDALPSINEAMAELARLKAELAAVHAAPPDVPAPVAV